MTTNFRNKQWFKNLSQDRKDKICKRFDIEEKTLRKSGRETEDGRIVVDILRIDHLLHTPKFWDECDQIISSNKINKCDDNNLENQLENIKYIYNLFNKDTKLLKYKQSLHNDLMIKQAVKYVNHWIDEYNIEDSDKKYCAYQIYMHVKSVIETDLKLNNKNL